LIQSTAVIEKQIETAKIEETKIEAEIRHTSEGTKKLEEITEEEVKAVTKNYEAEKTDKTDKMTK
jgi:hypothetical protein